jgi:mRNA-degrading endonuclease RelE of RelBE toxin-antitoxin system
LTKKYEVRLLKGARKDLESLPTDIRLQVLNKMKVLEVDPLPRGKPEIKILRGFRPPLLRLRSGDFRVVYRFSEQIVEVLAVVNRKELERKLSQLRN